MKKWKDTYVVILIFTDGKKIFIEKRAINGFPKDQYLFPGGIVEQTELNNLEVTLKREAMEELAVKILNFVTLPYDEEIFGLGGVRLRLFVITRWEGNLPQTIIDEGNPTSWVEIDEVLNCSFEPSRKIAAALKKYLQKYDSS